MADADVAAVAAEEQEEREYVLGEATYNLLDETFGGHEGNEYTIVVELAEEAGKVKVTVRGENDGSGLELSGPLLWTPNEAVALIRAAFDGTSLSYPHPEDLPDELAALMPTADDVSDERIEQLAQELISAALPWEDDEEDEGDESEQ